jgi:putative Mg2+ transporter-C (MgtC) family protein
VSLFGFSQLHLIATSSANIEGWPQIGELALAFILSTIIGIEREVGQKSAGLRTHALVGMGAALFMLISKYGFDNVLKPGLVVLDPSRVAAQIVTGVGFLGAGLIFVRRDSVRGLTTAAAVWVTAAVGAASGADLPILAVATTCLYLVVAMVFPRLARRIPRASTGISTIRVHYPDGRGILREILRLATARGFTLYEISTEAIGYRRPYNLESGQSGDDVDMVGVTLQVRGKALINELISAISELKGVHAVLAEDANIAGD